MIAHIRQLHDDTSARPTLGEDPCQCRRPDRSGRRYRLCRRTEWADESSDCSCRTVAGRAALLLLVGAFWPLLGRIDYLGLRLARVYLRYVAVAIQGDLRAHGGRQIDALPAVRA